MNRSFARGVLAGILAPLVFLAGVIVWVYKATGKVPCPAQRLEGEGVAVRLVEPDRALGHWEEWQGELAPVFDRICVLFETAKESSHRR